MAIIKGMKDVLFGKDTQEVVQLLLQVPKKKKQDKVEVRAEQLAVAKKDQAIKDWRQNIRKDDQCYFMEHGIRRAATIYSLPASQLNDDSRITVQVGSGCGSYREDVLLKNLFPLGV